MGKAESSERTMMNGRVSRRHPEGSEAHFAHQQRWIDNKSPEAKRMKAEVRAEERALRSPEEQIARLDRAFGVGVGATRERARLAREIEKRGEEKS